MRTLRLLALAALVPTATLADREITPLVGMRHGSSVEFSTGIGCIAVDGVRCPSFAKSGDESESLGFIVDWPVTDRLDVELLVNRQTAGLSFHDGAGEVPVVPAQAGGDLEVTHLHAGLRWSWELGRFAPFGAVGAGITQLESERPLFNGPVDVTKGSASFAAGTRVGLSERIGLRLEGRAYRVDLPGSLGPHMQRTSRGNLDQTELTAGLAVRF